MKLLTIEMVLPDKGKKVSRILFVPIRKESVKGIAYMFGLNLISGSNASTSIVIPECELETCKLK
jgi:hypothetical protein